MDKVVSGLKKGNIHLSTRVACIRSLPTSKVQLETSDGSVATFDHVILACHSDTALEILRAGNITPEEELILNKFHWNKNEAVLHSDTQVSSNGSYRDSLLTSPEAHASKSFSMVVLELLILFRNR